MKIETPVLKRIGPVPGYRGTAKCLDALERMYARAQAAARRELAGEGEKGASNDRQPADLHRRG